MFPFPLHPPAAPGKLAPFHPLPFAPQMLPIRSISPDVPLDFKFPPGAPGMLPIRPIPGMYPMFLSFPRGAPENFPMYPNHHPGAPGMQPMLHQLPAAPGMPSINQGPDTFDMHPHHHGMLPICPVPESSAHGSTVPLTERKQRAVHQVQGQANNIPQQRQKRTQRPKKRKRGAAEAEAAESSCERRCTESSEVIFSEEIMELLEGIPNILDLAREMGFSVK